MGSWTDVGPRKPGSPSEEPVPGLGGEGITGSTIDLFADKDSRWRELKRRIVFSRDLMAAMSVGSWASSENGLLGIDWWRGRFDMEMTWWHIVHCGMWDRWVQTDKALGCHERFTPAAQ